MKSLLRSLLVALLSVLLTLPAVAADKQPTVANPAGPVKAPQVEKKAEGAKAAVKQEVIDINTATETELKAISGIGDTYSKKIIAGRPYVKKDQLVSRKILPKAVYDKVKDKIIAKQVKK